MTEAPGRDRRAHIAEALWRVVAQRGIRAVSVRTVAAEAGIAVGSLRHRFPTQESLLEFSAELMIDRVSARITHLPPNPDDPVAYAEAAIAELYPVTPATRREFEINVALIAETASTPRLAEIRDRAHRDLLDLFGRIVGMLVGESPLPTAHRTTARRLLAIVDGLGLHLLHQPPEASTAWARDIVHAELVGIHRDAIARKPLSG